MQKIMIGLIGVTASLHGWNKEPPPPKVSYDTDLFRENNKIEFINLEFLYWSVNESAMDYALKMKNPAWGATTEGVGQYKVIDFGWNPGFRMNIGYFNAPHYWDAYLQYTYFKCTGQDRAHAPKAPDLFLNGTWPQPAFDTQEEIPLAKAHSSVEMNLNVLDFLATRRFFPNPHLRMRLYGGATVGWLRQNWEIDYQDTADQTSHLHNHWKFTGAGVKAGYILDWFLGKGGIFFTGAVSAAVYAGDYHNINKQHSSDSNAGEFNTALPLRNVHYRDTRLVPYFQLLVGPSWQMAFNRFRTELFAGYELNFWTNLHEVYRTTTAAPTQAKQTIMSNSVMGIQGLTARWNFDF
ncbi:MAG: Lpg1974 family pore-forming outer membrane protein [Rhabdochlamydiaceae bacterium]